MWQEVVEKTDPMDKALQYLATAMYNALKNFLGNTQLYFLKEGELEEPMEAITFNK